jgi:hypothetical protein
MFKTYFKLIWWAVAWIVFWLAFFGGTVGLVISGILTLVGFVGLFVGEWELFAWAGGSLLFGVTFCWAIINSAQDWVILDNISNVMKNG